MPKAKRAWTPEQRAAARQRALAYQARTATTTLPAAPSSAELLEASDETMVTDDASWEEAGVEGATEMLGQAGMQGKVTHTRAGFITLYDPQGNARLVPRPNLRTCLKGGLTDTCPKCRGRHEDLNPNACPAREPLLHTACPFCGAPIYESRAREHVPQVQPVDGEHFVPPMLPTKANRQEALQRFLNEHMMTFHPSESYTEYGLHSTRDNRAPR